jgi:hypothetical protein
MNSQAMCIILSCAMGASACAVKSAPAQKKELSFRVTGDPGEAVANAEVTLDGRRLAQTDAQGVALVTLSGHEGDAFDLFVRCPGDFQSPAQGTRVTLHRLAGNKRTEYTATCARKARTIVLAVNGMKGHSLPIVVLGRMIGETGDSGVATVVLHVAPNDQFEVMLDTSAPEDAFLRPRNPVATFSTKNEDDVFVFDPQLTLAPRPKPTTVSRRPVPVQGPPIPIRIQ